MHIFFFVWIFVQAMVIKATLFKQDQKERKSKAKNIIVQGKLVFLFKEHFNFVVFRISQKD